MNILEAMQALKYGSAIRTNSQNKHGIFYIQVFVTPLNLQEIWRFDVDEIEWVNKRPEKLTDVTWHPRPSISIDSILEEDFMECALSDILNALQEEWDRHHK